MIKKNIIFILIIMSILYIPSLTTQAKYEDTLLDYPIDELNGLTLNEVFEENNVVSIYDFIVPTRVLYEINDFNELIITQNDSVSTGYLSTDFGIGNSKYYIRVSQANINSESVRLATIHVHDSGTYVKSYSASYTLTAYQNISFIEDYTSLTGVTVDMSRIYNASTIIGSQIKIKEHYMIDLLSLGIDNLTKEEMDYYYNMYQSYKEIDNLDLNEEYSGYMETIWNTFVNFVKGTDKIITFATEPISFSIPKIEHDDEGDIVERAIVDGVNWIIGGLNTVGMKNYTILEIIITGWIVLLPMYLIKKFIPLL